MNTSIELTPVGDGLYDLMFGRETKARNVTLKQALSIIAEAYEEEELKDGS